MDDGKSWLEAESHCKDNGGHLASVNSQETKNFLEKEFLQELRNTWLGGYFEYGDWRWMWADCTPSWNGNLWSPFYPTSTPETSLCLIHHRGTQNWEFSAGCSSKNSYVCSKKVCPGICQLGSHLIIQRKSHRITFLEKLFLRNPCFDIAYNPLREIFKN